MCVYMCVYMCVRVCVFVYVRFFVCIIITIMEKYKWSLLRSDYICYLKLYDDINLLFQHLI